MDNELHVLKTLRDERELQSNSAVERLVILPSSEGGAKNSTTLADRAVVDLAGNGKPPSIYEGQVTMISRRGIDVAIATHGTYFVKWRNVREIHKAI